MKGANISWLAGIVIGDQLLNSVEKDLWKYAPREGARRTLLAHMVNEQVHECLEVFEDQSPEHFSVLSRALFHLVQMVQL